MADQKITALTTSTDLTATDLIPFVDGVGGVPVTKAIAFSDMVASIFSSSDYSGTYAPTLTNVTNISSSTDYTSQYMRVGNVVTVSTAVTLTPTAAGNSELGISLPIASNLTTSIQCRGVGYENAVWTRGGAISGDTVNDRASFKFVAGSSTPEEYSIVFTYLIA